MNAVNGLDILTERERLIIEMLSYDLSQKEIAFRLKRSRQTIKNHCQNIHNKLNVNTSHGAVGWYLRQIISA